MRFQGFGFQHHEGGPCGSRHAMHFARFGGGGRERFGHGFGEGPGPQRGFGRGRERMFDSGELQLVILYLLSETPSYGYQLIKKLEERLAGGYAPSPGVVYPTLTMLEEEGFATVETSSEGKKVYSLTDAGRQELANNKRRLEDVLQRLDQAGRGFQRGRSPQMMEAFMRLRGAVQARVTREGLTAEQIEKITEAINAAAKTIDEL